jgi:hypothetical protein
MNTRRFEEEAVGEPLFESACSFSLRKSSCKSMIEVSLDHLGI